METSDPPSAYGQHANAEISSQIVDTSDLLDAILSLQPARTSTEGDSQEDRTMQRIGELAEKVPTPISIEMVKYKHRNDESPLSVVLIQEISRYNLLLDKITKTLAQLERGIKGFELISEDLEQMMTDLGDNKVPVSWQFAYFSLKSLSNWIDDLIKRYEFFSTWFSKQVPYVFWISAFTYPTGFTTSLLQKYSRKPNHPSIDRLEFDFIVDKREV